MKIFLHVFILSFSLLVFSFGEDIKLDNTPKQLDQLRKEYLADKAALDQINEKKDKILEKNKKQKMPNSGPEWKKALKEWVPLWQKAEASYPKFLNAIVRSYCELPKTDKKARELKKEIEEQHPEHSKHSLTVSYYERHSLLANAILPHLYSQSLQKERAIFFVKLLKPSFNTKMEDFFHFFKLPAEPQDWSVQTAYSLANLRTGNFSTARKENKKLIKKGSKFDKITELKQLHLHRALIEAHDGKEQEARKLLAKALEMNATAVLNKNSKKLVQEIEKLLKER